MAAETRRAARQTTTRFAVRLLEDAGAESELASGLADLSAATDVAFEWLNREDPAREGKAQLTIVRIDDAGAETVWSYPPPPRGPGHALTELFGFNPVAWQPQSPHRPPGEEPRRSLPVRRHRPPAETEASDALSTRTLPGAHDARRRPGLADAAADAPAAGSAAAADGSPGDAGPRTSHRLRRLDGPKERMLRRDWTVLRTSTETAVRASWDDHLSRYLLIGAAFSTWLALALLDPVVLAFALAMLAALWTRQRRLPRPDPDDDI